MYGFLFACILTIISLIVPAYYIEYGGGAFFEAETEAVRLISSLYSWPVAICALGGIVTVVARYRRRNILISGALQVCVDDIEGNRIFLAREGDTVLGYLFGHCFDSENMKSIMPEHSRCFEVEELYIIPERRSEGIGKALFEYAARVMKDEADYITLSTATKNWKAILHFYLEELDMTFWSARLFKKI